MSTSFESIDALDVELTRLARAVGAQKYGLGCGLEALARIGGHHELGFSSVEAYALERCGRSARWVQQARALARSLEELPATCAALLSGRIPFSMALELAKFAIRDDEAAWLREAETRTVRQLRALMREREPASELESATADEPRASLTVTVDREDAWLFECARMLVRQHGGATLADTLEALVGEGTSTLHETVRDDRGPLVDDAPLDLAQRAWEARLAAWRDEAEARCECSHAKRTWRESPNVAVCLPAFDGDATAIDAELRDLAAELGRRDVALGDLAERFWKADGWRRLGYATETQYCRERLGCSLSSIKAKRGLARKIGRLRELSDAVAERAVGYEAARLVASIATPETETEWVRRARVRTVKCLREEVAAAAMLGRLGGTTVVLPPSEDTMKKVERCEARVVSGEAFGQGRGGQLSALLAELVDVPGSARRDPRARATGRVTLRFRAGAGLVRYFRWLEGVFQRQRPEPVSFLRFLSEALIDSWRHGLGTDVAYGHIYARDRYRCRSPVCTRRDATPHHLTFRSQNGDEEDENLATLCVWCHLEGVHGGRLGAAPPASEITWTIGASAHTVVRGRERMA